MPNSTANFAKFPAIKALIKASPTQFHDHQLNPVERFDLYLCSLQTVVESGVVGVEGLAVDWIGENLYWIVSDWDQIEVCDLGSGGGGADRRTVVSGGMESPRSLALDPRVGLLFWTDWDTAAPRIESCDMSGRV